MFSNLENKLALFVKGVVHFESWLVAMIESVQRLTLETAVKQTVWVVVKATEGGLEGSEFC